MAMYISLPQSAYFPFTDYFLPLMFPTCELMCLKSYGTKTQFPLDDLQYFIPQQRRCFFNDHFNRDHLASQGAFKNGGWTQIQYLK